MCFSATSSFAASALLASVSVLCGMYVRDKKVYFLAAIPFIFSIQQCAQGVVWLCVGRPHLTIITSSAGFLFLILTGVVIPLYLPYALWIAEDQKRRQRPLLACCVLGMGVSLLGLYFLHIFTIDISVYKHSIRYSIHTISWVLCGIYALAYCSAIVGPLLLSSIHRADIFGYAIVAALCVSVIVWGHMFIAVGAFFMALLSTILFMSVYRAEQRPLV